MKNIIKLLGLLSVVLVTFFSCDEESPFIGPNVELTPVYALTDIIGANAPFAINIYREKDLIIEYSTNVNVTSFTSASYADTSTDTSYEISVAKLIGDDIIGYWISADKTTGEGTLTVVTDTQIEYQIKISEKEVYN
ncbi:hypothetical protein [Algibacter lectus]|uniref:Uncharacterized protein n=1 Tax=Algibacter lectus TaxID=221126 RepID=A0A090VHR1_9FLAO|nr:hypothetical protein [Algibacter lectus]GAL63588.1 hypothetical protein JCM19300_1937 [Algibacter lectus]